PCGKIHKGFQTDFFSNGQSSFFVVVDNRSAILMASRVAAQVCEPCGEVPFLEGWRNKLINLASIIQMPGFPVHFKRCGIANAFGGPLGITMCYELYWEFERLLKDRRLAGLAWNWVFYHELGHTLLYHLNYPGWDNEDLADEFGAFVALLVGERDGIIATSKHFAENTSIVAAVSKIFSDDRHSLSAQRARNLYHWLAQPHDIMSRWHHQFLRNTQTAYLRRITVGNTPGWVDAEEVNGELRRRGVFQ
ncbi:MAG: hypothetical protein HY039_07155, partial [Nitrospirae bacterium]|nr:hypothetical protein [Nitrospirota bacterium]